MTLLVTHSLWERFTDPHQFCHQLRLCPQEYEYPTVEQFRARVMKNRPANHTTPPAPTRDRVIKVAHISDLHVDDQYAPGAPVSCTEPVCCRKGVTALNGSKPAGPWGAMGKCDLPIATFKRFISALNQDAPQFVLWTGDNTPHDIWNQSQPYNDGFTAELTQLMKDSLKAPVIPAAGNH